MAQRRVSVTQIKAALKASAGNVTEAARALGISRSALYQRINNSAELQATLVDAREELVDLAESALRKRIQRGDITAIIFTLKTLGKARGYVERQEHSGPDGGALTIRVVYADEPAATGEDAA